MVAISCSASVRTVLGSSSCRERQASTDDSLRRCVHHSPCSQPMQPHNTTQRCQPSRLITEVTSAGGDHLLGDIGPPSPDLQGHTQHTAVPAMPRYRCGGCCRLLVCHMHVNAQHSPAPLTRHLAHASRAACSSPLFSDALASVSHASGHCKNQRHPGSFEGLLGTLHTAC
jgi:hypothetical protein